MNDKAGVGQCYISATGRRFLLRYNPAFAPLRTRSLGQCRFPKFSRRPVALPA